VNAHGIAKGDRVAISMRNYPEWIVAFSAITSVGAIAVALNALWQPAELEFALNDSQPKVLFLDQERLVRLAECTPLAGLQLIAVRCAGDLPAHTRTYAEVLASADSETMPAVDVLPDDDATMLYTSGPPATQKAWCRPTGTSSAPSCHPSWMEPRAS
jgi:long-chain acyl-CoA synthetase